MKLVQHHHLLVSVQATQVQEQPVQQEVCQFLLYLVRALLLQKVGQPQSQSLSLQVRRVREHLLRVSVEALPSPRLLLQVNLELTP